MSEIALLTNPTAGRGRAVEARRVAHQRLTAAGHVVRDLAGADEVDAHALAARAVIDGVDALVVVGGDGLVNVAVQALATSPVALGVVPAGTGNDFARSLGLPRHDPLAATDRIVAALATGRRRRLDLALTTGGRYYVTVLCAGFDAVVNERANTLSWPRGQSRYTLATLAELRTFSPLSYVLELDGEPTRLDAMMVSVGNTTSYGGGLRITEGAEPDDGLLDVVVIKPVGKAELVRTYPKLFSGTHTTHRAYERHRVREVTVAAPGIVAYADGERFGPLPLTITCEPGALEVIS